MWKGETKIVFWYFDFLYLNPDYFLLIVAIFWNLENKYKIICTKLWKTAWTLYNLEK